MTPWIYQRCNQLIENKQTEKEQADEILTGTISDEQIDNIYLNLNREQINQFIHNELAKLPFNKCDVIDLYLLEQMNEAEIAKIKNIQVDTVKKYAKEGLDFLRDKLVNMI